MGSSDIRSNLTIVSAEIATAAQACGRSAEDVRLVAVSKRKPVDAVRDAYEEGQRDFGENRIQELIDKAPVLPDDIRWHVIGTLQRNKVKPAVQHGWLIHSVDSEKLLRRIDAVAGEMGKCQRILLQANISGEESKSGLSLDALKSVVDVALALPNVEFIGFMTMAPFDADHDQLLAVFGALRDFRDAIEKEKGASLPELSMGMSGDFHEAIASGATYVRVGTAIFGARAY
jgi:pyridoxal phosphate enzyme (YggS family)